MVIHITRNEVLLNNSNKPLFTLGSVYSTSAGGPSKQLKQIFQIEHNIAKNPNWPEANQLAIYKRGRGFEPETAGLRVRRADHSTTLSLLF